MLLTTATFSKDTLCMIDLPALSLAMCQMYIHAFFQKAFALLQSFWKVPVFKRKNTSYSSQNSFVKARLNYHKQSTSTRAWCAFISDSQASSYTHFHARLRVAYWFTFALLCALGKEATRRSSLTSPLPLSSSLSLYFTFNTAMSSPIQPPPNIR